MNARLQSALAFISADDRQTWIETGMALKSELGEDGFELWNGWSQQSKSYQPAAALSSWRSFRGAGISIGSLIHNARSAGWKDDDNHQKPSATQIQARQQAANERASQQGQERAREQQQAAKKAAWIMHQCVTEKHAYLHSKGFIEAVGQVWWPDPKQNLLCIPLRVGDALVGLQLIDRNGEKKFLTGQRTSGAEYLISNNGRGASDFWVEGYASALSLRSCLSALRMRYRIHVTFSAGNLKAMANSGYVIADNDATGTGEKVAIATGLPYWMSDVQGEDINDTHKRLGLFKCSQMLRKWLYEDSATIKIDEPPKHLRCDGGSKQSTCTRGLHA